MSNKVCGVGINDVPGISTSSSKEKRWLYSEWVNMLMRCYSDSFQQNNPTYVGCTVCDEWKRLSNFVRDAKNLPGWNDVVSHNYRRMSLDKDGLIVNNKEYSKYACQWMSISRNSHESVVRNGAPALDPQVVKKIQNPEAKKKVGIALGRTVLGIDPKGNYHEWYGAVEAARQLGTSHSTIQQACRGGMFKRGVWESSTHTKSKGKLKGWSFYWKDEYVSP